MTPRGTLALMALLAILTLLVAVGICVNHNLNRSHDSGGLLNTYNAHHDANRASGAFGKR